MARQGSQRGRWRFVLVVIGFLVAVIAGLLFGVGSLLAKTDLRAFGMAFTAVLGLALSIIKIFDQDADAG